MTAPPAVARPATDATTDSWWSRRRFGMFVHATAATVPAWAPLGQYSEWYWHHLTGDRRDAIIHPGTMAEVVAYHRQRWAHVEHYDDFVPLLTFDRFDAEEWAELACDAGAGYVVHVTKHHDGWCWWDAPNTARTFVEHGPRRNVVGEFAAACERNDLVFGTYYSLLDWGDPRYPDADYVRDVLHPHVRDLVERHGARVLWGDGHWGEPGDHWAMRSLLAELRAADPGLVVNDRWGLAGDGSDGPVVRTFEYHPPPDITPGPWELCRGLGASFGHNLAERAEHHLTGDAIVALATEVVAKGGNLLLNVGPTRDGTVPDLQAVPLRTAGEWIRRHASLLAGAVPWQRWGGDGHRWWSVDGVLHGVDLTGAGRLHGIDPRQWHVESVRLADAGDGRFDADADADAVAFRHGADGTLLLDAGTRARRRPSTADRVDAVVYVVDVVAVDAPVELFAPVPPVAHELASLLAAAEPGDVVRLGDGDHVGPAIVPAGVVLRGLGPGRTRVAGALTLERGARVEHLAVGAAADEPALSIVGRDASVLGVEVDGRIAVDADGCVVRASSAAGVDCLRARGLTVSRCRFHGNRWDVGVRLGAGEGHVVESCTFLDHLAAVSIRDSTGAVVRGNTITARWWGIRLRGCERAHVTGNRIEHTMRAVDVDGGTGAIVDANAVADGDSGCLVQRGAAATIVSGNFWERCRLGLLTWEAVDLHALDNTCVDVDEPAARVPDVA